MVARSILATRRLVLGRALRKRCPQCGAQGLFRGYARLADQCVQCALVLRREQGAQTGSMYLTAAVGEVFAAGLIGVFWWLFDWTPLAFVLVTAPLALAFCVFFLPVAQALWAGIEYVTDLEGHEPWTELRE